MVLMDKKIAISFIGTGNYINFFPKYYETLMEYFVPECEKQFFVFTDGSLGKDIPNNIHVIKSKEDFEVTTSDYNSSNWYNLMYKTIGGLRRFSTIKSIKKQLQEFDWYVYFDADIYCCPEIISYQEFFNEDKLFFGVQHPTFSSWWKKNSGELPYDRNERSLSCVKESEQVDEIYLQGCIWGGKIPEIFELINELDERIKKDLENGVLAKAHDESHLNRYRIENIDKFHVLHPSFAKPGLMPDEEFNSKARIIHSPKNRYEILGAVS
jgi:hypothetical protein